MSKSVICFAFVAFDLIELDNPLSSRGAPQRLSNDKEEATDAKPDNKYAR